ncbi:tissue factor pathway inhibitor 2 [Clupea harengus]|uniref:Tissue factor pathway inhibitor 2 n=1 Tax=Clupea harengus TaxID=7950 RepID=A0A6P3VZK1_CLUHA|nr:tissue factor pathway inhibitor 2 [Clupea harengus]
MEYYFLSFLLMPLLQKAFAWKPTDVCFLQADEGPCRADIQRYSYNRITQRCEQFSYGGCLGNSNNFKSYAECQKTCWRIPKIPQICRFPKEVGRCRALMKKYFFNMTSMQCEIFYYGGCDGNENRFEDMESCLEYCKPRKTVPLLCLDPLDKGRCSASIPRYYFNTVTKMCEEFEYSGCGGSNNNFVSRQSCIDVCGKGGKPRKSRRRSQSRRLMRRS